VGAEAVSAVHAASARGLETRAAGDCATELHHGTGDLIAHGDLAARDTGGSGMVAAGVVGGGAAAEGVGGGLGDGGALLAKEAVLGGGLGGASHCEVLMCGCWYWWLERLRSYLNKVFLNTISSLPKSKKHKNMLSIERYFMTLK